MIVSDFKGRVGEALVGLAFAISSPALADTTAVYTSPNGPFSMTIEVEDNGDVRGEVTGQSQYFITRAGEGFFVQDAPSGSLVTRVDDMATVMAEQWEKMSPPKDFAKNLPATEFVESGTLAINGRQGRAYFQKGQDGKLSARPVVVMSDDPLLVPLGKAMERQFAMSSAMMAQSLGNIPDFAHQMRRILETGAPLLFAGTELRSIDTTPIDASRFALPAEPETLEQVRERLVPASELPQRDGEGKP